MNCLSIADFASPSIFSHQPLTRVIWSGVKDRMVKIIRTGPGLIGVALTVGVLFGISMVSMINFYHAKKKRDLQTRCESIELAEVLIFAPAIMGTLFALEGKMRIREISAIISLVAGTKIGVRIKEQLTKNSDQEIDKFVQQLKKDQEFHDWYDLDLSRRLEHLRYFNPVKLGKKINEIFKHSSEFDCPTFILADCKLTDADLMRLGKAGWFRYFQKIDVNCNPQLTSQGLIWIGQGGGSKKLEILDLSRMNLTDKDLQHLAQSGKFNNLKTLILNNNPQITGKGLAWIAGKGFEGLKRLDLSCNSQVLKTGLEEWVEKGGFENLEVLVLNCLDLAEDQLAFMIEKAEWMKKLKGLDLDCTSLKKFPSNISKLIFLEEHFIGTGAFLSGAGGIVRFQGKGLFFRSCFHLEFTQEILELAKRAKL